MTLPASSPGGCDGAIAQRSPLIPLLHESHVSHSSDVFRSLTANFTTSAIQSTSTSDNQSTDSYNIKMFDTLRRKAHQAEEECHLQSLN